MDNNADVDMYYLHSMEAEREIEEWLKRCNCLICTTGQEEEDQDREETCDETTDEVVLNVRELGVAESRVPTYLVLVRFFQAGACIYFSVMQSVHRRGRTNPGEALMSLEMVRKKKVTQRPPSMSLFLHDSASFQRMMGLGSLEVATETLTML